MACGQPPPPLSLTYTHTCSSASLDGAATTISPTEPRPQGRQTLQRRENPPHMEGRALTYIQAKTHDIYEFALYAATARRDEY